MAWPSSRNDRLPTSSSARSPTPPTPCCPALAPSTNLSSTNPSAFRGSGCARTPEHRRQWQPGQRRSHLVVATPRAAAERAIGFGYGAFIPGYGGYVCYLGVDPAARGRGVGTGLFQFLFNLNAEAVRTSAMQLPFIIWESHRPVDPDLWSARVRLFDKVGGQWARGITLLTPNYMQDRRAPVALQVFIRPWDDSPHSFDAERLRAAVGGLYANVYRIAPDDPLYEATLNGAVNPALVPAVKALEED